MDELDLDSARESTPTPAIPVQVPSTRLRSIDLVRGLIMVIMALDHTRGYFQNIQFEITDLSRTSGRYFLTRWITHFCAPTFVFLAGVSAFQAGRRRTSASLASFLFTRGLWLIILEFTVIRFGWTFATHYRDGIGGGVLWAIGCSMIFLSFLVWFPSWVSAIVGLAMILLHNAFDGMQPPVTEPALRGLWAVLHIPKELSIGGYLPFFSGYPLIPWLGVMAVGYAIGNVFSWPTKERRGFLIFLGFSLITCFIALRYTNRYGDARPWVSQTTERFTVYSFLDCTKYPPSLLYLLMTLGPSLVLLGVAEILPEKGFRWLGYFGKVPMFFYILHIYLIHIVAASLAYVRFGVELDDQLMYNSHRVEMGYSLPVVYLIWVGVILALYLPCRWYAGVKARSKSQWLSYL
ncbi:heparan-alpha-glucosaminide N-acetyltransferase domain-containing protein [soil metagenome]